MKKTKLFGTSGIRGLSEELFTDQFCFDIGRTFSLYLSKENQNKGIAIGMDPRGSSPRIKSGVIAGLVYESREVYDQGTTPIPAINYILKVGEVYSGSIMVTGSHIAADRNGIKFFFNGEEILKVHEKAIEKIYTSIKEKESVATPKDFEIHKEDKANTSYQEMLMSKTTGDYPRWKVVVDPGDGAQSDMMPQVLSRLGLNVIEVNATVQGKFFARDTEVESNLSGLKKAVIANNADFGIGYDADGDRVVFIDENGEFIPGDYTGTLIARETDTDTVITPINTSQVVDHIGKKVIRTKVGSPYVVEKMKEVDSGFGFEANGGGIFSDMMSRDGGRTTIEILNILTNSGKKLSELVSELPKYYLARDKVDYEPELINEIMDKAKEKYSGIKVNEMDGLKIWIDDSIWILFRSSQNAPEFRVFAESDTEAKSKELLESGISLVRDVIS